MSGSIIYKGQQSNEVDEVLKTSEVNKYDGIGLTNIVSLSTYGLNQLLIAIDNAIGLAKGRLDTIEGDYLLAADETSIRNDFAAADTALQDTINALNAQAIDWDGTAINNIENPLASTDLKGIIQSINTVIGNINAAILAITPGTADTVLDYIVNNYVAADGGYVVTNPGAFEFTMNAGSKYIVDGIYHTEGATPLTLQDNKTNYIRYEEATGYQVESVAIGNPATILTGVLLWRVDINATVISAGVDLRTVYPVDGSLIDDDSIIARHVLDNTLPSTKFTNSGVAAATYTIGTYAVNAKGVITSATEIANFAGLASGDIQVYNAGTSKWENKTMANWLPSTTQYGFLFWNGAVHNTSTVLKEVATKIGIGLSPSNEKLEVSTGIVVGAAVGTAGGTIEWDGSDFMGWDGANANNFASIENNALQVDLPVYADNAAAKVGGLVDTNFYRTATGTVMQVYT